MLTPRVERDQATTQVDNALDREDKDMGRHEDKDKAEKQQKIYSNGHFLDRDIAPQDPGGKHSKKNEDEEDEESE
jgi:hypothetical protein